MFESKYSEEQMTRAILLVVEQGLSPKDASKETGISKRTIQRYKRRYIQGISPTPPGMTTDVIVEGDNTTIGKRAKDDVDDAIVARAEFLQDLIETKQIVLDRIRKVAKKSDNLDALQRTAKTLSDIEKDILPDDNPAANVKTVNMFQFFNQKLINEGYEGPKLSDADIVKGD